MKKKYLPYILVGLVLIVILKACGSEKKPTVETSTNEELLKRVGELEEENKKLKKDYEEALSTVKMYAEKDLSKKEDVEKDQTEEVKQETLSAKVIDEKVQSDNIPREYKNALKSAENYISFMPFSKAGLYEQLTSDAGEKYSSEAAQYAIDNLKVDYKEQALKTAKNYLNMMPMSDAQLKEQLMSDAGEKYTEEEAQYAIDNLGS